MFPDAAVTTGAITNRGVIAVARRLERMSYRLADAVTVLSDDLPPTSPPSCRARRADACRTIPNFVDTERIHPADRMTAYRAELGLGDEPVLLYAGNVGFSQSVELLVEAARRLPGISVVINGEGVALADVRRSAAGLANVRFAGYLPEERLGELLATGDVHAIPLRSGLAARERAVEDVLEPRRRAARSSPRSIPAPPCRRSSRRPAPGSPCPPTTPIAFVAAVDELHERPRSSPPGWGERGRAWVVQCGLTGGRRRRLRSRSSPV